MIIVGLLALWLPRAASFGVARLLGWLMVFDAVFQLIYSFRSEGVGHVGWKVIVAFIYMIAGIYFLTHPFLAVVVVTLALGVFFLAQGAVDVFSYLASPKTGTSHWILVNGIVSILLGAMIWRHWPTGSMWVLGVLVGVGMLMTGLSRLMIALTIRRVAKLSGGEAGGNLRAA